MRRTGCPQSEADRSRSRVYFPPPAAGTASGAAGRRDSVLLDVAGRGRLGAGAGVAAGPANAAIDPAHLSQPRGNSLPAATAFNSVMQTASSARASAGTASPAGRTQTGQARPMRPPSGCRGSWRPRDGGVRVAGPARQTPPQQDEECGRGAAGGPWSHANRRDLTGLAANQRAGSQEAWEDDPLNSDRTPPAKRQSHPPRTSVGSVHQLDHHREFSQDATSSASVWRRNQ